VSNLLRIALLAAVCVGFSSSLPCAGQIAATPDLSGTWVLNLQKSKMPKSMTIESEKVVVVRMGSIVEFHFTTNGKRAKTYTYSVDGKEHFLSEMVSSPNHFRDYYKAKWQGTALVVTHRMSVEVTPIPIYAATDEDGFTERWSLSPERRSLTRTFTGREAALNSLTVYDKQ